LPEDEALPLVTNVVLLDPWAYNSRCRVCGQTDTRVPDHPPAIAPSTCRRIALHGQV